MKYIALIFLYSIPVILIVLSVGCGGVYMDANDRADHELSAMKSPVILIGKLHGSFGWDIVLCDSAGHVESFGNLQIIANTIGESRNIGDTIK